MEHNFPNCVSDDALAPHCSRETLNTTTASITRPTRQANECKGHEYESMSLEEIVRKRRPAVQQRRPTWNHTFLWTA